MKEGQRVICLTPFWVRPDIDNKKYSGPEYREIVTVESSYVAVDSKTYLIIKEHKLEGGIGYDALFFRSLEYKSAIKDLISQKIISETSDMPIASLREININRLL
jgi:hypothetical protein